MPTWSKILESAEGIEKIADSLKRWHPRQRDSAHEAQQTCKGHRAIAEHYDLADNLFNAAEYYLRCGDVAAAKECYTRFAIKAFNCEALSDIAKYILAGYCATASQERDIGQKFYEKAEALMASQSHLLLDVNFMDTPPDIKTVLRRVLQHPITAKNLPELVAKEEK